MLSAFLLHVGASGYVAYAAMQTATAAESGAPTNPVDSFLQYGVLGLVVIGFATEWIVPGPQAKKLYAENQRLQAIIVEQVIPVTSTYAATMQRTNEALEKVGKAMNAVAHETEPEHHRGRERGWRDQRDPGD